MRHVTIATLLFLTVQGFGQSPIGTPIIPQPSQPPYQQLATFLGLSAAQLQSLEAIQQQRNQAAQSIYTQVNTKQTQLTAQLASSNPDPMQVGQLTIEIRVLQQQAQQAGKPFRQPALAVLTPDQVAKLQTLVSAQQLQSAANQAVSLDLIDSQYTGIIPLIAAQPPVH